MYSIWNKIKEIFAKEQLTYLNLDPLPIKDWKQEYLDLNYTLEAFQFKYLEQPHDQGNIAILLNNHLNKARQLIWASLNEDYDKDYCDEANVILEGEY